jgi:hypothetical protein
MTIDYSSWTALLGEVVQPDGKVDYEALAERRPQLAAFIRTLAAVSPDATPGQFPTLEDALAYWLNAYNAFVLAAIVEEYPIRSVWKTRDGQFFVPLRTTTSATSAPIPRRSSRTTVGSASGHMACWIPRRARGGSRAARCVRGTSRPSGGTTSRRDSELDRCGQRRQSRFDVTNPLWPGCFVSAVNACGRRTWDATAP